MRALFQKLQRRINRSRPSPAILMYHRIASPRVDPWGLAVEPARFEQHLAVIRRERYPLRMSEFMSRLERGRLPDTAIAVTFDDGYVDNLHEASPRLESADVPATMFLATDFVGQAHEYWWDELARGILLKTGAVHATVKIGREQVFLGFGDADESDRGWRAWQELRTERQQAYLATWKQFRTLTRTEQEEAMVRLRRDPSPHVVKFVEVDTDVRLEVLDWGGSGRALLLLAGGGDTAHVFDDLAPTLAKRYHVVGVTRRGHPGSSAPLSGYAVGRLAEDIVRVMDTVGLTTPVVVGHSYAGEEMHALGARDSSRVAGLVYVDAAFDRGDDADSEAFNAVARTLPAATSPKAADLASFTALRAYLEKYGGAGPEAHVRARWVANPDGSVAGRYTPDKAIIQAMTKEMRAAFNKPYKPERISVPAVAIYAVPKSADDLIRRGSSDRLPFLELATEAANDPAVRERVEKLYLLTRERVRNHEKWFEAFAERGRVVELSGTHHLIISNPGEVLQQIELFVSSLAPKP
jgi:pimeloyl-ACP methyl ester carboxylesterase